MKRALAGIVLAGAVFGVTPAVGQISIGWTPFFTRPVVVDARVTAVYADHVARLAPVRVVSGRLSRPLPSYKFTVDACRGGLTLDCVEDFPVWPGDRVLALIEANPRRANQILRKRNPDQSLADQADVVAVEPLVEGAELAELIARYQPRQAKHHP